MRKTNLALMTIALALPLSMQAYAADAIVEPAPEAPIADMETAPAYLWAGGYAGLFGGYVKGDTNGVASSTNGINGGAYGGYNWQRDQFVFGVEGDAGYSGAKGTSGAGVTAKQGAFGSLRARFGYDVNPFLLYGTVGAAATNMKVANGGGSDSNILYGYTVGAGIEAFVTEKITTRLEYRYTDYASGNFAIGGGTVSTGFDDHSVRAGIGMKF